MYFLIILFLIIFFAALITIRNDLRFLKQEQFQEAIDHSRFLRLMELIFNKYLVWRFWKKILPVVLLIFLVLTGITYSYIRYALPKIPPVPEIVIDHQDSNLLKRGEYLAEHVSLCVDCHSPRNVNYFSWPFVRTRKRRGDLFFPKNLDIPFPVKVLHPILRPLTWATGAMEKCTVY